MVFRTFAAFLLWLLSLQGSGYAQVVAGLGLSFHISYTGLYLNVTPSVGLKNFELYAGPKIALSETRIPTRGPYGMIGGMKIFTGCDCKFRGFVNTDYQYITFRPPRGLEDSGRIRVHELNLGFGMRWKTAERFSIESVIYAGGYTERWPGFFGAETGRQFGYNSMVKLGFNYYFTP